MNTSNPTSAWKVQQCSSPAASRIAVAVFCLAVMLAVSGWQFHLIGNAAEASHPHPETDTEIGQPDETLAGPAETSPEASDTDSPETEKRRIWDFWWGKIVTVVALGGAFSIIIFFLYAVYMFFNYWVQI